jgi:hypothetical protein
LDATGSKRASLHCRVCSSSGQLKEDDGLQLLRPGPSLNGRDDGTARARARAREDEMIHPSSILRSHTQRARGVESTEAVARRMALQYTVHGGH